MHVSGERRKEPGKRGGRKGFIQTTRRDVLVGSQHISEKRSKVNL